MGFPAGVRRDFEALERRRFEAADLLQQGLSQSEVARRVGAHRQSVGQWAEVLRTQGRKGLRKAGRAGRKPRLRAEDLRRIEKGLQRGPQALGYSTSLWTSARVATLIEQECGIRYAAGHAWRILRQLGWSCQRPVGRALERDEEKIRAWKQKRWPEIKKSPKRAADDRLHRRKRTERAPAPLPHLGAEGADAGAAISLQLEDAVGHGGGDLVELLLPAVSGRDPLAADHPVPLASAAPHTRQAADRLGRLSRPSQPRGVGVRAPTTRAAVVGVSSRLCAGAESGRVPVVVLEAARAAQLLPAELRPVERARAPRPAPLRCRPTLVCAFWERNCFRCNYIM